MILKVARPLVCNDLEANRAGLLSPPQIRRQLADSLGLLLAGIGFGVWTASLPFLLEQAHADSGARLVLTLVVALLAVGFVGRSGLTLAECLLPPAVAVGLLWIEHEPNPESTERYIWVDRIRLQLEHTMKLEAAWIGQVACVYYLPWSRRCLSLELGRTFEASA